MLKRYSYFFVYLLLVFLPIQAFATANMLICNSVMQFSHAQKVEASEPCHQHSASKHTNASKHAEPNNHATSTCQSNCASACASMCALAAIIAGMPSAFLHEMTTSFVFSHLSYASVTLPSLQRPPIFLI
jgi:hypothetical protein